LAAASLFVSVDAAAACFGGRMLDEITMHVEKIGL
jgi:hypothetical protein